MTPPLRNAPSCRGRRKESWIGDSGRNPAAASALTGLRLSTVFGFGENRCRGTAECRKGSRTKSCRRRREEAWNVALQRTAAFCQSRTGILSAQFKRKAQHGTPYVVPYRRRLTPYNPLQELRSPATDWIGRTVVMRLFGIERYAQARRNLREKPSSVLLTLNPTREVLRFQRQRSHGSHDRAKEAPPEKEKSRAGEQPGFF